MALESNFIFLSKSYLSIVGPNISRLIFHLDCLTGVRRLCISLSVAPELLAIAYGKGYLSFLHCYEIISRSWFIQRLTKVLQYFICHYSQYLALQTRKHVLYSLLQSIQSPPMPFFTLTLDFVVVLPVSKEGYNALMSVIYKFSKKVTLIKGKDTWTAKK